MYGTYTLGRGGSIPSNHLEPLHGRGNMVCRVLSNEFGVVRQYKLSLGRGGSTASKLLKPFQTSSCPTKQVLSHEFGVVLLYRTFSNYLHGRKWVCSILIY